MKATINGIEVEGTPEELAEFIVGQGAVQRKVTNTNATVVMRSSIPVSSRRRGPRQKWTAQENAYVLENYDRLGYKRIAKELGRGDGAVRVHMSLLRQVSSSRRRSSSRKVFPRGAREWTSEEIAVMQQQKPALLKDRKTRTKTLRILAKQFNRTKKAVTIRANMMGFSLYHWR